MNHLNLWSALAGVSEVARIDGPITLDALRAELDRVLAELSVRKHARISAS